MKEKEFNLKEHRKAQKIALDIVNKKEFNLSDKINSVKAIELDSIWIEDVKEFIRRETILLEKLAKGEITIEEYARECDKLAGDKLT